MVLALLAACTVGEETSQTVDTYLGLLNDPTEIEAVARDIEATGATFERGYDAVGVVRFTATSSQLAVIAARAGLLVAEPVLGMPTDRTDYRDPPRAARGTQITPWGVSRVGGSAVPSARRLWVFDTGVDADHTDLRVDRALSIDMVTQFDARERRMDPSHGTAVAGIAAALDNDRDVVGVAPGALIVSVRVLDGSGSGRSDVLVAGLEYAARHATIGDVLNLSLAARGHSEVLETAVARVAELGLVVVLAAGNAGANTAEYTPAALRHANVYTVSAIGQTDCLTTFSNYGASVGIAAPGEDILTLRAGGGTVVVDGTSFAAPHVAGLLVSGGVVGDGVACDDPDDAPDPIAFRRGSP